MKAIEFTTDLTDEPLLRIPEEVASRLPKSGKVRIILLQPDENSEDAEWRMAAYEQFLREDPPEDAVYDRF